jgi:prepilin-type N-terminal cleavage/methylation domain-containing protein
MTRAARSAGFTLIELVVVLAIVGLVLVVLLPRPGAGGETVALRAAATELRAVLRAARSTAIADNRDVVLAIEPDGRGYTLDGAPHALRSTGFIGRALRIEPAARIRFFATGGSSGGRLTIRGAHDAEQALEIDGVTGQVTLAH